MANIPEEVASAFLVKLIDEYIIRPMKRQLNYLCCFNANVQSLRHESKRLADARDGLQIKVDAAENNAELILPTIQTWLRETDIIQDDAEEIIADIPNVSCFSFKSRYSLSKKAKVKAKAMKKLRDEGTFEDAISVPAPPAATALIPFPEGNEFESRKQIEDGIMKALTEKATKIGICGMGGVGKTTMANKIVNRVREKNLFDEAVIVVVSQPVNMEKIQLQIAEYLGLKLERGETTKAHKLRVRLTNNTKRTLIVLDDIWEEVKLDDLGIPCNNNCTILLTSRYRDVLNQMEVKIFEMKILPEDEAWSFFMDKAGLVVEDEDLVCIAKQVAQECKGLPVALVTLAKALKGKRKPIWKDSLNQLRSSNPSHIPILKEVYNPLRLSYDFLEDEQTRYLFLLCSIFPEDAIIGLEELTWCMMGLGKLERIESLDAVRDRVFAIVDTLKSLNLLLDGENEYNVRMHDIIRDVAIFIARGKGIVAREWISIFLTERHWNYDEYMGSNFPNLRLLRIFFNEWKKTEVNDLTFLEAMKGLTALSMRSILCGNLPQVMQWPKGLRTLQLFNCDLDVVSVISELSCLEILICNECKLIKELPIEIGELKQLKLLDLSNCKSLERIAPGVISNLIKMEELRMMNSFSEWEATKENGVERNNASLAELKSLSRLGCLDIHIKDSYLIVEDLQFLSKIKRYRVSIGYRFLYNVASMTDEKSLYVELLNDVDCGSWIEDCARSVDSLCLSGDGANRVKMSTIQRAKMLKIESCGTIKNIVNANTSSAFPFATLETLHLDSLPCLEQVVSINENFHLTFSKLKKLVLYDMPTITTFCRGHADCHFFCNPKIKFGSLKELRVIELSAIDILWCKQISPCFFQNLATLEIQNLQKLKWLFMSSMVEYLVNLEFLSIRRCYHMENVIVKTQDEEMSEIGKNGHVTFLKLNVLTLVDLASLISFCRGMKSVDFPVLKEIYITGHMQNDHCGGSFHCWLSHQEEAKIGGLEMLEIEGNDKISYIWCEKIHLNLFETLTNLTIRGCKKIRSLFSFAIAEKLVNLVRLDIWFCDEMRELIYNEDERKGDVKQILFPCLRELYLLNLLMLKRFWLWRCAIELPMLDQLNISECREMEFFGLGSIYTPKLENIRINGELLEKNGGELNAAIIELVVKPVD